MRDYQLVKHFGKYLCRFGHVVIKLREAKHFDEEKLRDC